jgi:hypothetical protein
MLGNQAKPLLGQGWRGQAGEAATIEREEGKGEGREGGGGRGGGEGEGEGGLSGEREGSKQVREGGPDSSSQSAGSTGCSAPSLRCLHICLQEGQYNTQRGGAGALVYMNTVME